MTVRYTDKAARDLENLPRREQKRTLDALDRFAASGVGDVRALGGRWRGRFRLRVGDWRAILRMEDEIVVIRVSHRREVYR